MKEGETIVELGVYGIFVGNGFKQLNESAGHLLRAKFTGTDEGGVAAGYACLSSPLLCPDEVLYPMPDEDAEEDEEEEEEEAEENNNEDEDDDDEEDEDEDDEDEDDADDESLFPSSSSSPLLPLSPPLPFQKNGRCGWG